MTRKLGLARWMSLVTVLATGTVFAGLGAGIAQAAHAPPAGEWLNPDNPDAQGQGPGNIVSDKFDGTDDLYHFVIRLTDADGLGDIIGVEIQIEDGDADANWENIGTATQVDADNDDADATDDTWELFWDQSAHTPASDVNDDPGAVRAAVFTSGESGPFFIPPSGEPVQFRDQLDETAEITNPENGDKLGFYDRDNDNLADALMEGTVSAGITSAAEIELYYTKQPNATTDPDWIDCEDGVSVSGQNWSGFCELASGDTPAQVTAVAVRTDDEGTPTTDENGDESGDAHRVEGFQQTIANSVVVVEPPSDTEETGTCNTYTVTVRTASATDSDQSPVIGANIDVHATGPADDLQFATNADDPDPGDEVSDPFAPPQLGGHTSEPAAGCDQVEGTPDPGDDNDSNATGMQGEHENPTGSDQKHIEGTADADGFKFSIDSETGGATNITVWLDEDEQPANADNDQQDGDEPFDTATKTWNAPPPPPVPVVTVSPTTDTQTVGFCNTYTVTVEDGEGNRISGANVDVHATGPADDLQFALNGNDPDDANDEVSDPFTAPDQGGHTSEAAAGCDQLEGTPDPSEDNDSNATGTQGEHDNLAGNDQKHIEGSASANGVFRFSIDSETAGQTDIVVWYDEDGDDTDDETGTRRATATKTWLAAGNEVVTISPETDTQTVGFCNTYTVTVTRNGVAEAGGNIDVHAEGPAANLQFATNADDPDSPDTTSDPFTAPAAATGHQNEPAAGCDQSEGSSDAGDDNDSDATGQQGRHLDNANLKHIQGTADSNGQFRFSIDSETAGNTTITAWLDENANDAPDVGEGSDTATKTWQAADIDNAATTLDATPNSDSNPTGTTHTVTATVTDQNGNPFPGRLVHFRVMSGPHSDNDLDQFSTTPNGYFGNCTTNANGQCSQSYVGTEAGTDQIVVWINRGTGETGQAVFTPDGDDLQDTVSKSWFEVCIDVDPNTDTNDTDDTHQITATVTDGAFSSAGDAADTPGQISNDCAGDPLQGYSVTFTITDDNPDALLIPNNNGDENSETVTTNAGGQASVTLDNVNDTAGQNTVSADVSGAPNSPGDPAETGDTDVTKTWETICIDLDPNTDVNYVTATHQLTAFVTDGTFNSAGDTADTAGQVSNDCSGNPLNGRSVTFTITDDTPDALLTPDNNGTENTETVTTGVNGQAAVTLDNKNNAAGDNTVTADVGGTTSEAGDTSVTKTWSSQLNIDCLPEDATNRSGTSHQVNCTVTDVNGNGISGINVDFRVVAGPNAGYLGEGTTNVNGQVSRSYTGLKVNANGGSDLIDAFIDANDNDVDDGDNVEADGGDADTVIEAEEQTDSGDVSDFVDKVWTGCSGFASDPRNQFVGTAAGETITGTEEADIICGLDGNDTLNGLGGNDLLLGGNGNDMLNGGFGNDDLRGQAGNDALRGEEGNDRMVGGSGTDTCSGGPGADTSSGCP